MSLLGHGRRFGTTNACFSTTSISRPSAGTTDGVLEVESKMGAVAGGLWPSPRFPSHRVTGGGRPPPVPTERGVRISPTHALRKLVHSTASTCSSEYGRRSLVRWQ